MSAVLAAKRLSASLAAAPPHFTTVLALMRPAAPVVVLVFVVLLAALFAGLQAAVKLSFALDKLLDPCLRFLLVHGELLAGFLQIQNLFYVVSVLLAEVSKLPLQLSLTVLGAVLVKGVVLFDLLLALEELRRIVPKRVSFFEQSGDLVSYLLNSLALFLGSFGQLVYVVLQFFAKLLVYSYVLHCGV